MSNSRWTAGSSRCAAVWQPGHSTAVEAAPSGSVRPSVRYSRTGATPGASPRVAACHSSFGRSVRAVSVSRSSSARSGRAPRFSRSRVWISGSTGRPARERTAAAGAGNSSSVTRSRRGPRPLLVVRGCELVVIGKRRRLRVGDVDDHRQCAFREDALDGRRVRRGVGRIGRIHPYGTGRVRMVGEDLLDPGAHGQATADVLEPGDLRAQQDQPGAQGVGARLATPGRLMG